MLLDQGVGFFTYHDLMEAGVKGLIFQYGNVHYPNEDIDQRDLRELLLVKNGKCFVQWLIPDRQSSL